MKENAEVFMVASREIVLEVSANKLRTWSCIEIRRQGEVKV